MLMPPSLLPHLKQLRLSHLSERLLQGPLTKSDASRLQWLADLVQAECDGREQRAQQRRRTKAMLPISTAALSDVIYAPGRGLDRAAVKRLGTCEWIKRGQHLVITGGASSGKTWLACAFSQAALCAGLSVQYWDVPDLLAAWNAPGIPGAASTLRREIDKASLLVLDDWCVEPLTEADILCLRRVIHQRAESQSILVTSPRSIDQWPQFLDGYVGESMVDRIAFGAHRLDITGPKMRRGR